jgi:HEPN domain-containing protein
MKPATREWVDKAEADYDVVLLLLRSRKPSRRDPLCFHCQQCAEKYLKGRLIEAALPFSKTHDLEQLLKLCLPIEPAWLALLPAMVSLTRWAVQPRYPGLSASAAHVREAVRECRKLRVAARRSFGLPV